MRLAAVRIRAGSASASDRDEVDDDLVSLGDLLVDASLDLRAQVGRHRREREVEPASSGLHVAAGHGDAVVGPDHPAQHVQGGVGAHQRVAPGPVELAVHLGPDAGRSAPPRWSSLRDRVPDRAALASYPGDRHVASPVVSVPRSHGCHHRRDRTPSGRAGPARPGGPPPRPSRRTPAGRRRPRTARSPPARGVPSAGACCGVPGTPMRLTLASEGFETGLQAEERVGSPPLPPGVQVASRRCSSALYERSFKGAFERTFVQTEVPLRRTSELGRRAERLAASAPSPPLSAGRGSGSRAPKASEAVP